MSSNMKNKQTEVDIDRAIDELCKSTWKEVYQFVYYRVQNREQAEDITQETYVKAIRFMKNNTIQPEKRLAFLRTVALNILRDLWRKEKRRGTKVNIEAVDPANWAIEAETDSSADRMIIEKTLGQLTQEQRTVIELRILKGYSVADTAKVMGKNEGAVRIMQHRALKRLAKLLKSVQEGQTHELS